MAKKIDLPWQKRCMERDEHIGGMVDLDNNAFDRAAPIGAVERPAAGSEKRGKDGDVSTFLAALVRAQVLNAAIERLEKRDVTEHILDRRIENFSRLVASYAADSDLSRFRDEDAGTPIDEADLLRQLLSLTGNLRGGFRVLERSAQILGETWESDAQNFIEVTIGMTRLQLLMRKLVDKSPMGHQRGRAGRALIAAAAGEEHTFGQCMLDEILRAHGWETTLFNPRETSELSQHIKQEQAHLICFSWISSHLQPSVQEELDAIRAMPILTRPIIIAGGQAALKKDKWIVSPGVDQTCDSAYAATEIASKIIEAIEKSAQTSGRRGPFEDVGGQG